MMGDVDVGGERGGHVCDVTKRVRDCPRDKCSSGYGGIFVIGAVRDDQSRCTFSSMVLSQQESDR